MKKIITNKYILYTICFWIFIGPLLAYIFSLGLVAVGTADAISQIYPVMLYTKRLLGEFVSSLFTEAKFTFPMVNPMLGMGDDTIAALNWHGFGDPFYLLTLLSSEENLPYFYSILFYFRVYLGGIAFIAFVSELDNKKSSAAYVIGALVYSFTGFTLQSNMHAIFVHTMLYIPLMFLGAEKAVRQKRRGLLLLTTFCFALSGFYFLYIGSISLAVYVIYRMLREKYRIKCAIINIRGLIIEYILGLGLAAIVFIPGVIGFLSSDRAGVKSGLPMVLPISGIRYMLRNMFLPSFNSEQELSVCTIGMIALVCVLLAKGKRQEKINIALLFITAIVPFVSCVMSGFGECYGRWEIVIDMYIAFLVVSVWDELGELSIVQKTGIVLLYLWLGIVGKLEDILGDERFGQTIKAYGIILVLTITILPLLKKMNKERAGRFLAFVLICITICANWKIVARDSEITMLYERNAVSELLGDDADEEFCRIDNERAFAEPRRRMNLSLYQGFNGVMEYVSIENNSYITAFDKWDIAGVNHNIYGLDQRAIIETMSNVKYFVVRSQYSGLAPYGFEYVKSTDDGEWSLYENKYALPTVYAYDKVYSDEIYLDMSGLDRQQIMLQAAAAENYNGALKKTIDIENYLYEGEYTIKNAQGEIIRDDIIEGKAGDVITLTMEANDRCENYLVINTGGGVCFGEARLRTDSEYIKYIPSLTPVVVNLGAVRSDKTIEVDLVFNRDISFNRNELQFMYYDFSSYEKYIDELSKDTKGKFNVTTNNVAGRVDLDNAKMLCLSFPYSVGWHAKIDDRQADTYCVNDLFIGIEVPAGEHTIEFYYITPGIRIGAVISAVSIAAIIVLGVLHRKKTKFD